MSHKSNPSEKKLTTSPFSPPLLSYTRIMLSQDITRGCNQKRIAEIMAAGFLIILLFSGVEPSYPAELPDGKWIISKMEKKNSGIRDFSVNLRISFYALFMNFPLKAKLYFKRPDKVKMVFLNIPDILRGYEKDFRAVLQLETLKKNCKCKVMGNETVDEEALYVLKLNPAEKGNLKQVYIWVHSTDFTPVRLYLTYRDGSSIEVENKFTCQEGFTLINDQKVHFDLPQINARAHITYSSYKLNQNLPDSLFDKKAEGCKKKGEGNEKDTNEL